MIRTFKISDKLLQGFTVNIDNLTSNHNIEYCQNYVLNEMYIVLKNLNLESLLTYIKNTHFHCHEDWNDIGTKEDFHIMRNNNKTL